MTTTTINNKVSDLMDTMQGSLYCIVTEPSPGSSIRAVILPGNLRVEEVQVRDLSVPKEKGFVVTTKLYIWDGFRHTESYLLNMELIEEVYPLLSILAAGRKIREVDLNILWFALNIREGLWHSPELMVNQVRSWLKSQSLLD